MGINSVTVNFRKLNFNTICSLFIFYLNRIETNFCIFVSLNFSYRIASRWWKSIFLFLKRKKNQAMIEFARTIVFDNEHSKTWKLQKGQTSKLSDLKLKSFLVKKVKYLTREGCFILIFLNQVSKLIIRSVWS